MCLFYDRGRHLYITVKDEPVGLENAGGPRFTRRQIVLYTVVLILVTLLPVVSGTLGVLYATAAIVLGLVFLALTWRLRRGELRPRAALLFHYSLLYLALLFVAAAVDVL